MPFLSSDRISKSHFYTSLRDTSLLKLVLLLIPGIGNIAIYLKDRSKKNSFRNTVINYDTFPSNIDETIEQMYKLDPKFTIEILYSYANINQPSSSRDFMCIKFLKKYLQSADQELTLYAINLCKKMDRHDDVLSLLPS